MPRLHNQWNGNESSALVFVRDEQIGEIEFREVNRISGSAGRRQTTIVKSWCWKLEGSEGWNVCGANTWNDARRALVTAWLMSEDV